MSLERELKTYRRERPTWIAKGGMVGQWVVIHHEEVLGFFPTLEAALEAGYNAYGLDEPFMARQIKGVDRPIYIPPNRIYRIQG